MPRNINDVFLRGWSDEARNKIVEVYYSTQPDRSIYRELTPYDPANTAMLAGGSPLDGIAAGAELTRIVEGTETVVIYAQQLSPFASFSVIGSSGALVVSNVIGTAPTALGSLGSVTFDVSGVAGDVELMIYELPAPGVLVSTTPAPRFVSPSSRQTLITPGEYRFDLRGLAAPNPTASFVVTVLPFVSSLPAVCRDPEADNYNSDPTRASNPALCVFTPRMTLLAAIPPLVANGRPILIETRSAEIAGNLPAAADAFIDLVNLGSAADVALYVNGYRLSSGPGLLPTNFSDAESLSEALNAISPLVADYIIRVNRVGSVRITARAVGTPFDITLSTSAPALITLVSLAGMNQYRSQLRERWGTFLEIWTGAPETNPSIFSDLYEDAYRDRYGRIISGGSGAPAPVLAQRIEMDYRADNRYQFDIAAALRQFTGHAYPAADGSCPDRLTSYFLKYGETYATPDSIRRQRNVYVSPVGWALDAVEIVAPFAGSSYLLSKRPAPWRSFGASAAPTVLLGNAPAETFYGSQLSRSRFDGSSSIQAGPVVAQGRVTRLPLSAAFLAEQMSASVSIAAPVVGLIEVAQLDLLSSAGQRITFANGQGGFDTIVFEGTREEITKRSSATYATTVGTGVRSAQLPEAFRLNSGLLTRAEWLWLRRELGNSPATWLETADGPQPVALTAFAAEADELLGLYTITIDCDPQLAEIIGLTN